MPPDSMGGTVDIKKSRANLITCKLSTTDVNSLIFMYFMYSMHLTYDLSQFLWQVSVDNIGKRNVSDIVFLVN